ncbi:hypothetical protein O7614_25815 [Micromonospora sp. WMMD961]|uniref:hypothetical protein n=1 Tax=Micromonospora sp. WMMD961 TaxID=3016100 RepID=UPI002415A3E9|nr:hypothetical protein [Micromonospora sp. WMMD961]MDG4783084.1 hypothetical protein [Micromonospora sp. WMMD961]
MNSLKGFGICFLLAATLIAMRELAEVEYALLVLTVILISVSTGIYVASRRRYRKDRRIVGD